jgi:hypothetical protein
MGDLSLQVSSPLDAIEHYATCIIDMRADGDHMWLAGALEGYTSTVLLMLHSDLPIEEILCRDLKSITAPTNALPRADTGIGMGGTGHGFYGPYSETAAKAVKLAEQRASEAMRLYSRHVAFSVLAVECALRIARLCETAATFVEESAQKVSEFSDATCMLHVCYMYATCMVYVCHI